MTNPKALRELCERATPGPWLLSLERACVETTQLGSDGNVYGGYLWSPDFDGDDLPASRVDYLQRDGEFIAAARSALPALLDENERLRALLTSACNRWEEHVNSRAEVRNGTSIDNYTRGLEHEDRATLAAIRREGNLP
jgi:hypothetical protein